ncbi:DUF4381 domain-containing protein [Thiolapillus sp.]
MNDPLSRLHDIHLPPPVGWWPPAPGWWLLLLLVIAAGVLLAWLLRRRSRRLALYRDTRQELERIRRQFAAQGDFPRLAAELSRLLRRTAITLEPEEEVAGLTGEAWLAWLDSRLGSKDFTTGPGRHLVEAAYRQAGQTEDAQALLSLVETWLEKVTREASRV